VATVGILAAIAIPAYQDYTIRSQVTEGLNLSNPVKASVAQSYVARGTLPKDRRAAGLPPAAESTSGRFVEKVDVTGGVVTVTYGKTANPRLRGKTLTLIPFATAARDVIWRCGYAAPPAGARSLVADGADAAASTTTIDRKYLPAMCR
jgi:type IV pilus assembly protein PilA